MSRPAQRQSQRTIVCKRDKRGAGQGQGGYAGLYRPGKRPVQLPPMLGHQGHAAFHWVVKGRGELQPLCVQTPRTSPGCCSPSLRSSLLPQLMFVVFQTSLLLLSPTFSAVLPVRPPKGANPRAPPADEVSSCSAPVFLRAHGSSLALRTVSFAASAGSMADASVSSRLQAGTVQRRWAEAEMERDLSRFWKGTQGLLRRHSGLWSSPEQRVLTLNLTAGRSETQKHLLLGGAGLGPCRNSLSSAKQRPWKQHVLLQQHCPLPSLHITLCG